MSVQIRTFSGDIYDVPDCQLHEIDDYRSAVKVIKLNRQRPVPIQEYTVALATMMKYEEGRTGWSYVRGK